MIDYNNRQFVTIRQAKKGEVSSKTYFSYKQEGSIVSATYSGGDILKGNMVGVADENGNIQMTYSHINQDHEIRGGTCTAVPQTLPDGRLQLTETWTPSGEERHQEVFAVEEVSEMIFTPQIIFN
ncbi:n-acetylglutamate synthase [Fictibacillus fluitans]|uniref:N-acetylglutamate synthase n=1 Tax=Fictibacillus fluitans TaxID=3058422 RepID=A0ABT8I3I7_9BACL|nr:n-acetylglutamate synthase [Fictibacillus sp. NE201]MDN4527528.1 n-acetylglutamate synthase [Fictibacillus sp. NE201]